MDIGYWHQRWEKGEIGFHERQVNPALVDHIGTLGLDMGARLFLPLCGKTRDIAWLLEQGFRIAGVDLSPLAISELFQELDLAPKITPTGKLTRYSATNIDIWVGDIFDLSSKMLGPVDAIYDRAALVALPEGMRNRYTAHLIKITDRAPQLLICYEYDQSLMEGPPFSISDKEVDQHYRDNYDLTLMVSTNIHDGLKGKCAAKENVWILKKCLIHVYFKYSSHT
jgi:thiopurine S-methyltransferase